MKIAVGGGTGVAGRWTAEALRADGHEVLVISRSAGADLVTGVVRARGDRRVVVAARLPGAVGQARPRLVRVAYAIIGSHGEAEDVVAECWFRLVAADQAEPVRDVEAWAVVAVSRMALDLLRSARVRRERYVGPWLPVRRRVH